jgi:predicted metal-dependent peptidase
MSKPATTADNSIVQKKVALTAAMADDIPQELKQQCLNTALYEVHKFYSFAGSVLQVMNIAYSYMLPTAGVMFNADMKRYEMLINPKFFCKALNDKQRMAVLIHEIYHVLNKHLIRVPFMRISEHKRILMNIAGDMSINQTINNLPKGCKECPPIEDQQKGQHCKNALCPGSCIDVADWHDTDEKTKKKTQWPRNLAMEQYFEKLMERYEEEPLEEEDTSKQFKVDVVLVGNLDATASGSNASKRLTSTSMGSISNLDKALRKDRRLLLTAQTDARDNGIHVVEDEGSDTTPFVLKRLDKHDGTKGSEVNVEDAAIPPPVPNTALTAWVVTGAGDKAGLVLVDQVEMHWKEVPASMNQGKGQGQGKGDGSGSGKGLPRQFDTHNWDSAAEESEVLDATEDLVKRAMVKNSMSYDELPGHIKDLLADIKSRKAELNYKALILSAIKRSATGTDRKHSWTRRNRRYGFKSPGTKEGDLPKLHLYLDTSGSISTEELTEFLAVVDEFLKVGSRKCEINLFSDNNYFNDKYKLGDRNAIDKIRRSVSMGGTCLESSMKQMLAKKGDLAIVITDGYYGKVGYEAWLKPGQRFPQVLWVISNGGTPDHPMKDLGQTVKIIKSK